jgi:cell division inhibitor SepF
VSAEFFRDYNHSTADHDFEEYETEGIHIRVLNWVRRHILGEPSDEELESVEASNTPQSVVSSTPSTSVRPDLSIRQSIQDRKNPLELLNPEPVKMLHVVQTITDNEKVFAAANALKEGQQILLSLDGCSQMVAEEVINFLCGVCFAVEGESMKVTDKVFVFTPRSVKVQVDFATSKAEDKTVQARPSVFDQQCTGTI